MCIYMPLFVSQFFMLRLCWTSLSSNHCEVSPIYQKLHVSQGILYTTYIYESVIVYISSETSVCNYTRRYSNTTFMVKPQYICIYIVYLSFKYIQWSETKKFGGFCKILPYKGTVVVLSIFSDYLQNFDENCIAT